MSATDRTVIDLKTREPWRIEQHEPTEAEKQAAFIGLCSDSIVISASKIRAIAGLDAALRVLHQAADTVKNYGKK